MTQNPGYYNSCRIQSHTINKNCVLNIQVYLKMFLETAFRREKHFSCITKIHITHSQAGLLVDLYTF